MRKRIIAWCLLIGFVLLIVNILILKKFLEVSFIVYMAICAYYLVTMKQKNF
mgnify:CR=1 FL=1